MDEARLIQLIHEAFEGAVADGAFAFLDDVGVLPAPATGETQVVTTDLVVEGEDFRLDLGGAESAGHRAVLQNLSDLAASGARPVAMVWTLALPPAWLDDDAAKVREFASGAASLAREHGLALYGGDLSATTGPMSCSITAMGVVEGTPLSRRGARAGDSLYLSRRVGASAAGLASLVASGGHSEAERIHLWGEGPELALGQALVGRASACLDVSDGLARDLYRLCRASGVSARLDDPAVWVHPAATAAADAEHQAREWALFGGEDYALLFSLPAGVSAPEPALRIGEVTTATGTACEVRFGDGTLVPDAGHDHFAAG